MAVVTEERAKPADRKIDGLPRDRDQSIPRYPITIGPVDGNAFSIMGAARKAIRKYLRTKGKSTFDIAHILNEYSEKAKSGDYENLIRVSLEYVDIRTPDDDDDDEEDEE